MPCSAPPPVEISQCHCSIKITITFHFYHNAMQCSTPCGNITMPLHNNNNNNISFLSQCYAVLHPLVVEVHCSDVYGVRLFAVGFERTQPLAWHSAEPFLLDFIRGDLFLLLKRPFYLCWTQTRRPGRSFHSLMGGFLLKTVMWLLMPSHSIVLLPRPSQSRLEPTHLKERHLPLLQ